MDTLVLKNTGNVPLYINDMGIEVLSGEDLDLIPSFSNEEILESLDFPLLWNNGGKVILTRNSVIYDMSLQDVIDYLIPLTRWDTLDYEYISNKDTISNITSAELEELTDGSDTSLHNHNSTYNTKTNLITPGESQVHWDNIIGSPTGNTRIVSGDLYFQDQTRNNKWLTATEEKYVWMENVVDGKYMSIGNVNHKDTGYLLPQDFTLTKIAVIAASGYEDKEISIRVNSSDVFAFNLINLQYINTSLNIDANTGDILKIFVSGSGPLIKGVVVTLFGKWRTL